LKKVGIRSIAVAAALAATASHAQAAPALVELHGSELVLVVDGVARPAAALVGAMLTLALEDGSLAQVRVDRVAADPRIPEGDVFLYDLSIAGDNGAWTPVCEPEADGAPHAILQRAADGQIAIFCTGGALGKCIRLGYRPWAIKGGVSLDVYWRACVKMIRADYCGDDQPTTLNGMLIDIYDPLGIQKREGKAGLTFEAAWYEDGALCVAHPRVPQKATLQWLADTCPRLAGQLGPECTETSAERFGTPLMFNASRGDGVPEQNP
jgi:ADYC domain